MKLASAFVGVVISLFASQASAQDFKVLGVVDGDTLLTEHQSLPNELKSLKVRVFGVDTPEKGSRAKCDHEAILGEKATQYTKVAVTGASNIVIRPRHWDKYGGRFDADVFLDGASLAQLLIKNGLGRPYDGGKKSDWCK